MRGLTIRGMVRQYPEATELRTCHFARLDWPSSRGGDWGGQRKQCEGNWPDNYFLEIFNVLQRIRELPG